MQKVNKITYALAAIFAVVVFIFSSFVGGGAAVGYAATSTNDIQAVYEQTNVLDNLDGAIIGGELFDIKDYPHNDRDKLQVITFVEFCYSYYTSKQNDYGLYVYVYNPQDLIFDTRTERNRIQLKYGNSSYSTYPLQFLNYSTRAGYEGRFYKFKVNLTENERKTILKALPVDNRTYEISGITLCVNGVATEYPCAQKYKYTGYVKGYGSELAETDTLNCTVDGFEKYVELDVKHTFYRPDGDYYNGEQSQLNSCYFRVPNKFFEDYGELSKIACEWYEYFTKPILVTEDNYIYNKINALHGADTNTLSDDMYFLFNVFWENAYSSWFSKSGISDWTSNYDYEVGDTYHWGFLWLNGAQVQYDDFTNFAAAFYTGGKPCEDYDIDGEVLKSKLLTNSNYLGGEKLNDRYSKYLFENYVQQGYEYGYNRKEINADDMLDVFWNITTKSLWQTIFGGFDVETVYDSKKAIEIISSSDLAGTDSEIAGSLYINENDVKSLKAEYSKATANNERLVLFRYSTTKYMCAPCTASYCSKDKIDGGKMLVKNNAEMWNSGDFNAYVAQETVYLDFDIISLWFTAEDGTETEVPVVMSPQDVISGITPPPDEDYHNDKEKNLIALIIGVLAAVLIVLLFYPILSPILGAIVNGLIWLITTPFKAIGKLFKRKKE